jgi:transcriptional regulator with XRE-family HTH domain
VQKPEHHLGQELRQVRVERQLSQQELSFRADLALSYVSQLERGLKSPSFGVLLRIAAALDTPASVLVAAAEERMRRAS